VKYVEEYRDPALARALVERLRRAVTRPWTVMEICGGQTHSILRHGIDQVLPPGLELVHGPGCPVCVTPLETIDRAVVVAARPEVILTSFGDMLRVPGSHGSLLEARSRGADVRVVYSPLEALALARAHPDREVVFLAVGFETTAPGNALAVHAAATAGLANYSQLVSQVLVPPAMTAILESPGNRVQAFLAAGHVCVVTGWRPYEPVAARHGVPIVATGFEPVDILDGLLTAVERLERGQPGVVNRYARAVRPDGNPAALAIVDQVYEVCDRKWRGIGVIPASGLRLRQAYATWDAEAKFAVGAIAPAESAQCIAGTILQGRARPADCAAFGRDCTPQTPLGATMVSSEGACAAWYRYGRRSPA
jgi:hydrogenase expression/formation protein HypD